MTDNPLDIFRVLKRHGVPFVIIGGHAVAVHGYARATEDADIIFLRTPESEQRLLQVLEELAAYWISNERDPATGWERQVPISLDHIQARPIMWLTTSLGFLDIMDHVPGIPDARVQDVLDTALQVDGLPYVSKDWLLRMKRASNRARDQLDVSELEGE
jgi:hypothetical protein